MHVVGAPRLEKSVSKRQQICVIFSTDYWKTWQNNNNHRQENNNRWSAKINAEQQEATLFPWSKLRSRNFSPKKTDHHHDKNMKIPNYILLGCDIWLLKTDKTTKDTIFIKKTGDQEVWRARLWLQNHQEWVFLTPISTSLQHQTSNWCPICFWSTNMRWEHSELRIYYFGLHDLHHQSCHHFTKSKKTNYQKNSSFWLL